MVSVIVPIYGVEQYLNACLDSIAAQSFSDLEVILVDDGSPDNCPAICDARAASDPRFRVIHRENGGLACARNTGLRLVTGDYVLFVDSDDLLPPDAVKSLLSALISTDADMARGTFLRFTETPPAVIAAHQPPKLITPEEAVAALIAGNNAYIGNTVWRALYRRSVLWDGMFPDGRNFEDVSVSPRLFARCRKICLIPDTVYFYRKNRSASSTLRDRPKPASSEAGPDIFTIIAIFTASSV